MSQLSDLDLLKLTAFDLQDLLVKRKVSTQQLVQLYLGQIERHNHKGAKIGAIISIAPRLQVLEIAKSLDLELETSGPRSPFHGIRVIVKDVFNTPTLGMQTTCGSLALKDLHAEKNAEVVDCLLKAGMIVIGKTNLSELGAYKSYKIPAGWSAVGKQTQSPYVRGGILPDALPLGHSTPAGSSSGVGAGVASGFAPLGVGTESDGSLVQPATRAALYGIKVTINTINTNGSMGLSSEFDSVGAVGKTTKDMATLLGILQGGKDYSKFLRESWDGLKVGFVDPELWWPAEFMVEPREDYRSQVCTAIARAVEKISATGAKVAPNVHLINVTGVFENGVEGVNDVTDIMDHDFRQRLENYLAFFHSSKIKTLEDIIQFNLDHSDEELPEFAPDQLSLIDARDNTMSQDTYDAGVKHMQETSRSSIRKSLEENGIDVIIGPADARIASVAACAGFPVATVPLGFADFNGRAFGMNIIALAGDEEKMIGVMSAWESTFPEGRASPPIIVNWKDETESLSSNM